MRKSGEGRGESTGISKRAGEMRQEGCQGVRMSMCASSKAYVLELRIISYSCGLSVCVCRDRI